MTSTDGICFDRKYPPGKGEVAWLDLPSGLSDESPHMSDKLSKEGFWS